MARTWILLVLLVRGAWAQSCTSVDAPCPPYLTTGGSTSTLATSGTALLCGDKGTNMVFAVGGTTDGHGTLNGISVFCGIAGHDVIDDTSIMASDGGQGVKLYSPQSNPYASGAELTSADGSIVIPDMYDYIAAIPWTVTQFGYVAPGDTYPTSYLAPMYGFYGFTAYTHQDQSNCYNDEICGIVLFIIGGGAKTVQMGLVGKSTPEATAITNFCPATTRITGFYVTTTGGSYINGISAQCGQVSCESSTEALYCACPAGQINTGTCQNCAVGTWSEYGFTACEICTDGQYVQKDGSLVPASVVYTSFGTGNNNCPYDCGAGYYLATGGCVPCDAGTYSVTQNQDAACTACGAGTYSNNVASSCTPCSAGTYAYGGSSSCTLCGTLDPSPGHYVVACTLTSPPYVAACPTCPAGQISACASGSPACSTCPAGTYQPSAGLASACLACAAGFYTASSGSGGCKSCTNPAPLNGSYAAWVAPATSATCPVQCKLGLALTTVNGVVICRRCSNGYYIAATATACAACTPPLPSNAYWLTPVVFDGAHNACPWDCNAGYYQLNGACLMCPAGTFSAAAGLRPTDAVMTPNVCESCSASCLVKAGPGTYQASACTSTQDITCPACSPPCGAGYYTLPCNAMANEVCFLCKTTCSAGNYMVGTCSGSDLYDVIQCLPCKTPAACPAGTFLPAGQCPGNGYTDAECEVCSLISCPFGTYEKACTVYADASCVNYTQCPAGATLRGRGLYNDGVCANCTQCARLGLRGLTNCSQYADTLCAGVACGAGRPCAQAADQNYFCDFTALGAVRANATSSGTCGACPQGYASDGVFCYACPSGSVCNSFGAVACEGAVPPGTVPVCVGQYGASGPVACPVAASPSEIVTLGTYLKANGDCSPYFDCAAGTFKHFYSSGLVACEPCTTTPPLYFEPFSGGLSVNDPTSCLYECQVGLVFLCDGSERADARRGRSSACGPAARASRSMRRPTRRRTPRDSTTPARARSLASRATPRRPSARCRRPTAGRAPIPTRRSAGIRARAGRARTARRSAAGSASA